MFPEPTIAAVEDLAHRAAPANCTRDLADSGEHATELVAGADVDHPRARA